MLPVTEVEMHITIALWEYALVLPNLAETSFRGRNRIHCAVTVDSRKAFRPSSSDVAQKAAPSLFAAGRNEDGTIRTPEGVFTFRALDDNDEWANAPAIAKHLRECLSTRLKNGTEDQVLLECLHRDNRHRLGGKPATFYALVRFPWGGTLGSIENLHQFEAASEVRGPRVHRDAIHPDFERMWKSGEYLDFILNGAFS